MSCRLGAWSGLAVVAGGAGGPLQHSVPQVCGFAEISEPVQSVLLLLIFSNFHPKFVQGPLCRRAFAGLVSFLCDCSLSCVSVGPQESQGPHGSWGSHLSLMEMGWSLRLEGREASCQIGLTILWENHSLVLRNGPRMFHPSWFKLWRWLPAQLERRIRGSREGWEAAAGQGSCSGGTASAGERQGTLPRAVGSLASPIQDCLVLLRQCLMCFLVLFYLVIEMVSN